RATRRTPDELRVAHSSIMPRAPSVGAGSLARERVRTQLELHDLARRPLAAFHVEGCARTDGRPQAAPLPAGIRVVDASVHPLRVEAERVRYPQIDEVAVHEREQRLVAVARRDRHVAPES